MNVFLISAGPDGLVVKKFHDRQCKIHQPRASGRVIMIALQSPFENQNSLNRKRIVLLHCGKVLMQKCRLNFIRLGKLVWQ